MTGLEDAKITVIKTREDGKPLIVDIEKHGKLIQINDDNLAAIEAGAMIINWGLPNTDGAYNSHPFLAVTTQPNPDWNPSWGNKDKHNDGNRIHYRMTPEIFNKFLNHRKAFDKTFDHLIENYAE